WNARTNRRCSRGCAFPRQSTRVRSSPIAATYPSTGRRSATGRTPAAPRANACAKELKNDGGEAASTASDVDGSLETHVRQAHTHFKSYPEFLSKKRASEPVRPAKGRAKAWTTCSYVGARASAGNLRRTVG